KIGTIQRRLAWPLHKDDTLSRSGRSTDLNICFVSCAHNCLFPFFLVSMRRKAEQVVFRIRTCLCLKTGALIALCCQWQLPLHPPHATGHQDVQVVNLPSQVLCRSVW
ncbi:hypothetical protein B0H10DRAFT_1795845, partial [Mycena sp. CBHHK59/15]